MVLEAIRQMTVAEYLVFEEGSEIKHEYIDGELYPMTGGTMYHAITMMNLGGALWQRLKGTGCTAMSSAMRIRISPTRYVYADASVVCGEPVTEYKTQTLLNPTLVAEVTSPSSIDYDRGLKREFYQSIPSLQIYLIIDQDRPFVELHTRQEAGWTLREFSGLDASLPLEALDCELPLAEIYHRVDFDAAP